jgi:predicted O-linked N-acetylglucosamine transferase (SPINDLY family)
MVQQTASDAALARAKHLFQQGNWAQAEACCMEALQETPNHPDALCLQGMIARQRGNHPAAVQFISKALELQPDNTAFWNNLGLAVQDLGHRHEAINMYRQGLQFNPRHGELLVNLALALANDGQVAEAEEHFQKALKADRDNPVLKDTYATHLARQGQIDAAIQQWRKALQSDRKYWPAAFKMGVFYFEKGDLEKAIAQLEHTIRLNPLHEQSYFYLAHAHRSNKQPELELATYRRLIEQNPQSVFGHTRLGVCNEAHGNVSEAATVYDHLVELQPQAASLWKVRRDSMLTTIPTSNEAIDTERRTLLDTLRTARQEAQRLPLTQVFEARSCVPSIMVYQGRDDLALKTAFADWLVETLNIPVHRPRMAPVIGRKIRIGFLLTENHERVFKRVMSGYLKFLDRKIFELQIICPTARVKGMQYLLSEIPDLTYLPLGDIHQSVDTLHKAQLDVLFYFEIGTDPRNYMLSLYRFAPVQCTSWGFPSTSGSPNIDYYISSQLIEPENAQSQYRETLLQMDCLPCYYHTPSLPDRYKSRAELNLPEQTRLYTCVQTLIKFHPDFDDLLRQILERDPQGVILLVEGLNTRWTEALKARLETTVSPYIDRVRFLPHLGMDDYLSLLNAADVILDTPHFGGGLTTYETMAVGTPLVTLAGASMKGRYGAGCYTAMGLPDLIAHTTEDYVALALRIANEPDYREQLRQAILEHNAVLFEDMNVIRRMESLLLQMVQDAEQRPE